MRKQQKKSRTIFQKRKSKKNKPITPFEKLVYKAVSKIPTGEVRSYKWVAKKIGFPNASRAIGQALNKNPFIGIVPCHRVIRSDGSLGGFSKGAKVKKRILKREGLDLS